MGGAGHVLIYVDRMWRRPTATPLATVFEATDAWFNGFTHIGTYRQAKKAIRQQLPAGRARQVLGVVPEKQSIADLRALLAATQATRAADIAMEGPGSNPFAGGGGGGFGGGGELGGGGGGPIGPWVDPYGGAGTGVHLPGDEARHVDLSARQPSDWSWANAQAEQASASEYKIRQNTYSIPKNGTVVQGIQAGTVALNTPSAYVRLVPTPADTSAQAVMDGTCVQPRVKVHGTTGESVTLYMGIRVDPANGTAYVADWDHTDAVGACSIDYQDDAHFTIGSQGYALITLPQEYWRRGGVAESFRQCAVKLGAITQTVDVEAHFDEDALMPIKNGVRQAPKFKLH